MHFTYSIIIPAYNEQNWLALTLGRLRSSMSMIDQHGELIVVDNNSTDDTASIAADYGATVVFEPINQISKARNAGAAVASGDYLVFVDADTLISADLLKTALARLESGHCIGGGTRVEFDMPISKITALGLDFWNWISIKLGLAAGCFFYCRHQAFEQAGGFSEKVYASEEIWLSRQLGKIARLEGRQFCIIQDQAAISSGRKLSWYSFGQQLSLMLLMTLFPFFVRFKSLCGFWYKRPENIDD